MNFGEIFAMKKRNYGIDLLRLVSMFYVIMLHVLGQGGVLSGHLSSAHFFTAWFLETAAYCAVDCFGIISGYVGYREDNTRLRISHYLTIWLQVVFYGILLTIIFSFLLSGEVGLTKYIKACMPVTLNLHWYFTAYTGLVFMIPILNAAVQEMESSRLKKLTIINILIFSALSTFWISVSGDIFYLKGGYTFVWLLFLYFLGAAMKKTGLFSSMKRNTGIALIVILILFSELWSMYGLNIPVLGKLTGRFNLIAYVSPTILCIAIIHVILFTDMKLSQRMIQIVKFAGPGAFAVYLLNTQHYAWQYLKDRFVFLCDAPLYQLIFVTIGFSALFVILSVSIDKLRQLLFKTLHIGDLAKKVEERFDNLLDRILIILQ